MLTTTVPNGAQTVDAYDHLGRPVQTTLPSVLTSAGTMTQPMKKIRRY